MAEKKSFLIRIDAETLEAIQRWAADEMRSVNGQIEYLLRRGLADAGRLKPGDGGGPAGAASSPREPRKR